MPRSKNDKFIQSIHIIYDQINQPIKLEDIANQVGMSLASLKRLFQETVEQSPGTFIRRLRMELAFRSLQDNKESILQIALEAGFEDHAAFSRSFKKTFGYSPSQSREKINLIKELDSITLEQPNMIDLETIEFQCVTEKGTYFECAPRAWTKLEQILNPKELSDDFSGVYIGVGIDNPHDGKVPYDQVQFSAGVTHIKRSLSIEVKITKAGKYAQFVFCGKVQKLGLAYHHIFGQWAESTTEEMDSENPTFMLFEQLPRGTAAENISIFVPLM